MNKLPQRMAAKKMELIKSAAQIAQLIIAKQQATTLAEQIALFHTALAEQNRSRNIQITEARLFRLDGRLDMRRYRRYVLKHRKPILIVKNNKEAQ